MRRRLVPICIGILILCVMTWFQATQIPAVKRVRDRVEHLFYDEVLKSLANHFTHSNARIVIVDIDEESISKIGRWPWPRRHMIDLVNHIKDKGAAVLAFDIVFGEEDENPIDMLERLATGPQKQTIDALESLRPLVIGDAQFAQAIKQLQGDVVLGFVFHDDTDEVSRGVLPSPIMSVTDAQGPVKSFARAFANIPVLQESAKSAGFMTGLPDSDGVVRKAPLVARFNNHLYPSLALEAARVYLATPKTTVSYTTHHQEKTVSEIALGEKRILTDEAGQLLIPFKGGAGTFPYLSASKVLKGEIPPNFFDGALVVLGSSSFRFGDLHATPQQPTFPGVEIQATVIDAILSGQTFYVPAFSRDLEIALTVILGLLLAFTLPFLGARGTAIVAATVLVVLVVAYYLAFTKLGMVFAVTASLAQVLVNATFNLGYGLIVEGQRRNELKHLFGQYVPKEYVEIMTEHPERYSDEGSSERLTVLFADIIGFSTLVEKLSAREIRSLLNSFFTPMTQIIFSNKGTIDKYVGDMLMAFWGAPISDPLHVQHALQAALKMRSEVRKLQEEFTSRHLLSIDVGIGINTGDMFVGDMGSEYRKAYTVLGDSVNVASRLEGLVRFYGAPIVVGEATREGQDDFVFRMLDRVRVKGRKTTLTVFELVCLKSDLTQEQAKEIQAHEEALQLYFAQQWSQALSMFKTLSDKYPNAKLYKLFIDRIEKLSKAPAQADWDGAYEWIVK